MWSRIYGWYLEDIRLPHPHRARLIGFPGLVLADALGLATGSKLNDAQ